MPKADQLEPRARIVHPVTEQTVEVVRVRKMLAKTRIHFKAHGTHGSFDCPPDKEIKAIT